MYIKNPETVKVLFGGGAFASVLHGGGSVCLDVVVRHRMSDTLAPEPFKSMRIYIN